MTVLDAGVVIALLERRDREHVGGGHGFHQNDKR